MRQGSISRTGSEATRRTSSVSRTEVMRSPSRSDCKHRTHVKRRVLQGLHQLRRTAGVAALGARHQPVGARQLLACWRLERGGDATGRKRCATTRSGPCSGRTSYTTVVSPLRMTARDQSQSENARSTGSSPSSEFRVGVAAPAGLGLLSVYLHPRTRAGGPQRVWRPHPSR